MYENGIVVVYDTEQVGHQVVTLPGWAAGDPQMAVALYLHGHRSYADVVRVVDWSPCEDVEWASDGTEDDGTPCGHTLATLRDDCRECLGHEPIDTPEAGAR